MISIGGLWLCPQPQDMREGADRQHGPLFGRAAVLGKCGWLGIRAEGLIRGALGSPLHGPQAGRTGADSVGVASPMAIANTWIPAFAGMTEGDGNDGGGRE
jgi:hypothetical protein